MFLTGERIVKRIILTEYRDRLFFGLWENDRPAELAFYEKTQDIRLGDVYLARVKDVVPGIRAAFVQLSPSQNAYLPMEQAPPGLRCGDELPVQVVKEAQKTKDPVVTASLSLTGRLAVLVADGSRISISGKIHDAVWKEEARRRLTPLLQNTSAEPDSCGLAGFVVRTAAYLAPWEELEREAAQLAERNLQLRQAAGTRACYSCLLRSEPLWLSRLYNLAAGEPAEILTDLPQIHEICEEFLQRCHMADHFPLRLYEDSSYPLSKLYSLDSVVEGALQKKVWLKSGGYLVIEPTEALVAVDVNSGKAEGHRSKEENILRLNLEAAEETARQMRLRNLSGMILIDFIDMKEAPHREALMNRLKEAVRQDPVSVSVIDMTKLGIVECTRKRTARPLHEQLKGIN